MHGQQDGFQTFVKVARIGVAEVFRLQAIENRRRPGIMWKVDDSSEWKIVYVRSIEHFKSDIGVGLANKFNNLVGVTPD